MIDAGFALMSFETKKKCHTSAEMFSISPHTLTIPTCWKFDSYIEKQGLERLIYFANHCSLHYPSWPVPLDFQYNYWNDRLAEVLKSYCLNTAKGYKKFLRARELNRVTFFMPQISFSERFRWFNMTFFHEVEMFNGKTYFCIGMLLPDEKIKSTIDDVKKYVSDLFENRINREIIADNTYYAFEAFGRKYTTGYTTLFRNCDFVKINFDVDLNFTDYRIAIATLGVPSYFNHKRRLKEANTFTEMNEESALSCFFYKRGKHFDYEKYRSLVFQQLAVYDGVLNLYSFFLSLLRKESRTTEETLQFDTVKKILQEISLRYKIRFKRDIERAIKGEADPQKIAACAGSFTGAFVSQTFSQT